MKVLHLGKYYPPYNGGIETVTYDLVNSLNDLNIACDVLCLNDSSETLVQCTKKKKIIRAGKIITLFSMGISYKYIYWLYKLRNCYDVIHVHFPNPLAALSVLLVNPKAKIIVHWHNDIIKQKILLIFVRPIINYVLKKSMYIIGTTEEYINKSDQLRPYLSKVKVIPLAIDIGQANISDERVGEIRNKFIGKNIILSLGRLVYYKGFDYLISAAEKIPDDCVVLIGGAGPLQNKLNELIKNRLLQNKVFLIGNIPHMDVPNYISAAKAIVVSSTERAESFCVVQLEAMALSKPVINTNIVGSGVPFVSKHLVSGITVPPKNADSIAIAITALLRDDRLYDKLSAGARNRYQELFTLNKMIADTIKLYNGRT